MTVQQLIAAAYEVPLARVFDGPDRASTDRYDIVAKAAGNPTTDESGRLLQTLLRERFRLSARQEQRVLPVYALTMARPSGNIGPRLWRSEVDCTDRRGAVNTMGRYDISVDWASSPDVDSVSVFTAVQEQLGLRLESTTAPLDVVVIEAVERPTEN